MKQGLASAGVPVLLVLQGAGDVAVLRHGGRLVEAEPFVEHDGVADSWERYGDAFALLGKMHRVLAAVDIAVEEPEVSNYGTPDVLLGWTQQLVGELRPLAPTPEVRHAREICRRAMQLFGKLQEQWSGVRDALPRQLTHGDYGGGNVLF
ncbi:MAG: phosphotransferase, partial [Ktedonobacteraceae bacterium]|nr:phosphotransferase [Ktedonobacteraceae bacterium]